MPCASADTVGHSWTRAYYVNSLASDFLQFQAQAASLSIIQQVEAFRHDFEPQHLRELESGPWRQGNRDDFYRDGLPRVLQALSLAPATALELHKRERMFQMAIPRLASRLQTCFKPGELRLDRPFVLGLDFGAPLEEVTRYQDRNTLFLSINHLAPDEPSEIYLAAQMFRLLRCDVLTARGEEAGTGIGYAAFREGAARCFANEQVPGFTDREVLGYTHAQWRMAIAQQQDLTYELLRYFDSSEPFWVDKYLGNEPTDGLIPPRAATYVGYVGMQRLRRRYGWDEMIHWTDDEVRAHLVQALGGF